MTEQYLGKKFEEFVPMPAWEYKDYLGWGEQGDGKLFYGIYIQVPGEAARWQGSKARESREAACWRGRARVKSTVRSSCAGQRAGSGLLTRCRPVVVALRRTGGSRASRSARCVP